MKKKILDYLGITRLIQQITKISDETAIAVNDRWALAKIELLEEIANLKQKIKLLIMVAVTALCLIQVLTFGSILLLWDTVYRIPAVITVMVGWSLLFLLLLIRLCSANKKRGAFEALRAELSKDIDCIKASLSKEQQNGTED